jgi:PIN domain nuclease of toxin-antitoxin system
MKLLLDTHAFIWWDGEYEYEGRAWIRQGSEKRLLSLSASP